MPSTLMDHSDIDPREEILNKVGDLSGVEVFGNDILCAIYQRPTKTKSGIILSDKTVSEDLWQGKVFLVLKMGPTAFVDEDGNKFRDIAEGDWVVGRSSDGWAVQFNSSSLSSSKDVVPCRIISDLNIRLRVSAPDIVY
jgi:co-chaperonin GroES (HSP10)